MLLQQKPLILIIFGIIIFKINQCQIKLKFAELVTVLSGTHQTYGKGTICENDTHEQSKSDYDPFQSVQIGSDCWLGVNSVILLGVTIAKGTVVGANAVVAKDFPEYSILGGVPAKLIGSRTS